MRALTSIYSKLKKGIPPSLLAFFAGAALPLAFAPHHIWFIALLSPSILARLWFQASPFYAFRLGFCFGLGMFGVGVSWVYVSIHHYGNTAPPLAILITGLFVFTLACYPALQGYLVKKLYKNPSAKIFYLLAFPSSWVLFEWLRGWLFSGFPWLYLGYTQLDTFLGNYAPILSVYGASWMLLLSGGCFIILLCKNYRLSKSFILFCLMFIWIVGFGLRFIDWTSPKGSTQTVSLVQGNVDPLHKFAQHNPIEATEMLYGHLTNNAWRSDIIIWPENAIPLPLPYSQAYIDTLNARAKASDATLITGIQHKLTADQYYNSLIIVGMDQGIYHKQKLVPFGEFLPFESQLRGLIHFFDIPMSNFIPGPSNQPLLYVNNLILAPLICYEIAYPELTRTAVKGTNAIINISEDGWFGTSWGPHQHLQIAQMRAKETGRMLIRATTSGISAVIDTKGEIIERSHQFQAMVLYGTLQGFIGNTPWMIIGLWPILIFLLTIFLIGLLLNRKHIKQA